MHGVREIAGRIFWSNEMKYITMGQLAVIVLSLLAYMLVNPLTGVMVAIAGLLTIQFCAHTYWTYRNMKSNDDFDHNPLVGAVVGVLIMYVVSAVVAAVVLGVLIYLSMATGYPLVLPGLLVIGLGWLAYHKWG